MCSLRLATTGFLCTVVFALLGLRASTESGGKSPRAIPEHAPLGDVPRPVTVVPASTRSVTPTPNVVVNDRSGEPLGRVQSEVSIAVDGDTLVVGWNDSRGFEDPVPMGGFATSTDRGDRWTDGGHVPPGPLATLMGDPSVVRVPGDAWVYASVDLGNDDGIGINRGVLEGGTIAWTPSVGYVQSGGEALDKPYLDVDPETGRVYLAYVNWSQNRGELTHSDDGGVTWADPLVVFESSRANGYTPVAGARGDVFVFFTERMGVPSSELLVRHSPDGAAWSGPPVAYATLGAESHLPPVGYNRTVNATFADVAVDRSLGVLIATWSDGNAGGFDCFAAASVDDGLTWSAPVRLNDNGNRAVRESFWPRVTIQGGRITVVWYDRRHAPGEDVSLTDVYAAQSLDGGGTWSRNRRLSDASVAWAGVPADMVPNFGDYIDVTSDARSVFAVWSDARNGDPDVVAARVDDVHGLALGTGTGIAGDGGAGVGVTGSGGSGTWYALADVARVPVSVSDAFRGLLCGLLANPVEADGVFRVGGESLAGTISASDGADSASCAFTLHRVSSDSLVLVTSGGAAPFALAEGWTSECTFTPVAPGAVSLSGHIGGATRGTIVVSGDIQLLGAPSLEWDVEQRVRQTLAPDSDGAFWWIRQEADVLAPAVATATPVPAPPAAWPTLRAVPNPAPAESRVTLTLASPLQANVSLFTPSGRRVRELWAGNLPAGVHDWWLDARGLAPGVYFLRAEGPGVRAHAKLVLAR